MVGKLVQVVKVAAAAIFVSVLLIFVCAFFAYKLRLGSAQINLLVAVIYAAGSFIAGFGVGHLRKEKRLLWGVCAGIVYFLVIMLISLIVSHGIGNNWGAVVRNLFICAAAGGIGGIVG